MVGVLAVPLHSPLCTLPSFQVSHLLSQVTGKLASLIDKLMFNQGMKCNSPLFVVPPLWIFGVFYLPLENGMKYLFLMNTILVKKPRIPLLPRLLLRVRGYGMGWGRESRISSELVPLALGKELMSTDGCSLNVGCLMFLANSRTTGKISLDVLLHVIAQLNSLVWNLPKLFFSNKGQTYYNPCDCYKVWHPFFPSSLPAELGFYSWRSPPLSLSLSPPLFFWIF